MTATSVTAAASKAAAQPRAVGRRLLPRRNPWGHPWFLEGFTWLYLIWSLVPIALAVLFSFNNGKSQSAWQGFSWRWYFADPVNSVLHNPQLHAAVLQTLRLSIYTTVIAVPLGVAFALGINRWRGGVPATFNFVMILSFVIPELIFGVAMFFVFTVLPMIGDYYTNQLLSGAASTSMIGNLIQGQLGTPGLEGQGAVLSLMLLLVLVIPMAYYVIATNREAAR